MKGENIQDLAGIEKSDVQEGVTKNIPTHKLYTKDELSLDMWISIDGAGTIGRICDIADQQACVKVYSKHSISLISGKIFLDKTYTRDKGFWKPWHWKGGTSRIKRLKNIILKDEDISTIVKVDKSKIKPIQGVLYG